MVKFVILELNCIKCARMKQPARWGAVQTQLDQ